MGKSSALAKDLQVKLPEISAISPTISKEFE